MKSPTPVTHSATAGYREREDFYRYGFRCKASVRMKLLSNATRSGAASPPNKDEKTPTTWRFLARSLPSTWWCSLPTPAGSYW